jgi:NADPH:quinone reductase-like Zn-dependent oxidoreductase
MISMPSHHTSIRQTGESFSFKVQHDSRLRPLDPDMVLVKTAAVSINPSDVKSALRWPTSGTTSGTEFAGYVVALGSNVQRLRLQDRVCGVVHGSHPSEPDIGAFGEYVTACEHVIIKIPDDLPWANAAAIPLSGLTSAVALFHSMGIPATPEEPAHTPFWVLVWGGATACGTMAIQLLKLYDRIPSQNLYCTNLLVTGF